MDNYRCNVNRQGEKGVSEGREIFNYIMLMMPSPELTPPAMLLVRGTPPLKTLHNSITTVAPVMSFTLHCPSSCSGSHPTTWARLKKFLLHYTGL